MLICGEFIDRIKMPVVGGKHRHSVTLNLTMNQITRSIGLRKSPPSWIYLSGPVSQTQWASKGFAFWGGGGWGSRLSSGWDSYEATGLIWSHHSTSVRSVCMRISTCLMDAAGAARGRCVTHSSSEQLADGRCDCAWGTSNVGTRWTMSGLWITLNCYHPIKGFFLSFKCHQRVWWQTTSAFLWLKPLTLL